MRAATLAALVLVTGCGGGGPRSERPASAHTPAAARVCLEHAGFKVTGGPRGPDDANAPDYELIVTAPTGPGAFLAFYDTLARAERYEPQLRRNAKGFRGAVERRGKVTVVLVSPPRAARAAILRCVS